MQDAFAPRHLATSALLILAIALLAACAPRLPVPDEPTTAELAAEARSEGELSRALRLYREAEQEAEERDERAIFRLYSADVLVDQEQVEQARAVLETVDIAEQPDTVLDLHAMVRARLALEEGEAGEALDLIDGRLPGEDAARPRLLDVRAEALSALDRHMESAGTRAELEELLTRPGDIRSNRERLWESLQRVPMQELREVMPPAPDLFGGWIELAFLVRSHRLDRDRLEDELAQWNDRYEDHPAADRIMPRALDRVTEAPPVARHVAVLLPLSGGLGDVGQAVREGMLAAHFSSDNSDRPALRFIDVGESGVDPWQAYRQAVEDGAELVVGPLTREDVETIATGGDLPVPVLALNSLPTGSTAPPNLFRFGLMPEHDAAEAARFAASRGLTRALVFVPMDDWGRRVARAFTSAFEEAGGQVVAQESYMSNERDFAAPLRRLLGVTGSRRGGDGAQRRQDVDMIFIGAFPQHARLIQPQIQFHHGTGLPILATSHVYGGDPREGDSDVEGIVFMDTPWMLDSNAAPPPRRGDLERYWEDRVRRQARLFALGMDAYRLIPTLGTLHNDADRRLTGATGVLRVDEGGNVLREELVPARFTRRGVERIGQDR